MAIHTIRNNTGQQLELWDVGVQLANLADGQAVHTVPITITSVTRGGVGYHNRQGAFVDGDSYEATFIAGNPLQPATVRFTGNQHTVSFT